MKKLLTILFLLLFLASARSQDYRWAYGFGGDDGNSHGNSIATDAQANVYATGYFGDTIDFDPTNGIFLLNSDYQKMFVTKYDSAGNYQWALTTVGSGISRGNSIAVNASGVYVTGEFYGTLDFDPGPLTYNLQSNNLSADVFIAKYDLNGNFIWAINMGGPQNDAGNSIAVDVTGNIYVTGYFRDTVADFDPSGAVANISANGNINIFIAKYDSNGNYLWAHGFGEGTFFNEGRCISVDPTGVVISGIFTDTTDFDPAVGTALIVPLQNGQGFLAKYNFMGNYQWGFALGNVYSHMPFVSGNGSIYVCGGFSDTLDFDPGIAIANLYAASGGMFIANYDFNGNYLWANNAGGPNGGFATLSFCQDSIGSLYLTGWFSGTTDFDPSVNIYNLTAVGGVTGIDIFFAKYDSSFNFYWARAVGGLYHDKSNSVTLDQTGSIYITGYFKNTMDFDPGPGIVTIFPSASENIFIGKYSTIATHLTNPIKNLPQLLLYPNPASDFLRIDFHDSESTSIICLEITDITGRVIVSTPRVGADKEINIKNFNPGMYIVSLKYNNIIIAKKFMKK